MYMYIYIYMAHAYYYYIYILIYIYTLLCTQRIWVVTYFNFINDVHELFHRWAYRLCSGDLVTPCDTSHSVVWWHDGGRVPSVQYGSNKGGPTPGFRWLFPRVQFHFPGFTLGKTCLTVSSQLARKFPPPMMNFRVTWFKRAVVL